MRKDSKQFLMVQPYFLMETLLSCPKPRTCSVSYDITAWGLGWLRHCATSREVPGSIPGVVTGDFFRGTPDRTMCPEVDSTSESEYQ